MTMRRMQIVILAAAVAACSDSPTAPRLDPQASCQGQPRDAIVSFADEVLGSRVRVALGAAAGGDLTCGQLSQLDELNASALGIRSLVGIQNAVSLVSLDIGDNEITDFSPVA